jgi:DNA-binding NarL/FixJ family response regulator
VTHRVLVCDDHPIVRDALSFCLKSIEADCEVGVCATVGQVLEQLSLPGHWDLVVLDLLLPDARGIEALIRVRGRFPDVRVAVLSAVEDRDSVDKAMRAGAVGFLPKSYDRGTLVGALRQLLGLPSEAGRPVASGMPAPDGRTRIVGEAGPDDTWIHEALAGLSARQMQVLRLLLSGAPNKEICRELGVSENTVKIHIGSVLRALRARTRTEAVGLATRVGFGLG